MAINMEKSEEQFKKELTPEQYHIMREGATEQPFTGKYHDSHEKGMYVCAACGQELFSSDTKFESGTGWPSFTDPANRENVELLLDETQGMQRVEVRCKKCGSHLGHVFDDGPADKGGKRYCINSACLELKKSSE
ncbi:MAG: peptide-methionine (R)-S-oxide reductase MsrB [Candidatus Yanofskybacteria bacterium]|nr:peptide-methionine (R)-S-oxide reductase MsrB [Candidatus Yanofskybacteria bacterium]